MKWRDRELNPPLVIVTRLILWPVLQLLRCLVYLVLLVGWNHLEARNAWEYLG